MIFIRCLLGWHRWVVYTHLAFGEHHFFNEYKCERCGKIGTMNLRTGKIILQETVNVKQ